MEKASLSQKATFGDCDPAGIVFYPNYFAWFDRTFHSWLRPLGGHQAIVTRLGAIGIGLMHVDACFHSPARDGDDLRFSLAIAKWAEEPCT